MDISKYQKVFGVGPLGMLISAIMLGFLWLLDKNIHHAEISSQRGLIRTIGLILILIWVCWHSWCVKTISQWWRHDQMCISGPYRLVRHPIYAGGIFFAGPGVSVQFNSWVILLLPVFMYVIYAFLVRKEETMMTSVFGEEYRRYAMHTGRFFPRFLR